MINPLCLLAACTLLIPAIVLAQPERSETEAAESSVMRKVDTVAALRALTKTSLHERCEVSGYYTTGDGGGASYLWSATSTAADDGGSVIRPTNIASDSPGRFLLLWDGNHANVKVWGAKGDGSTDDLSAIDAAIAALPVNSYDNPVQPPGAGKSGAYHLGTLILPAGGRFMVSDTVYLSPRMEVILDGSLEFLPGAAPSAATEKFVINTLTGSNSVGNPNTTFGVSIHGRGLVVAGSPTANPGGSGIFWQNANYGAGLRDVIVGECALRGVVASVQGGNIDGLWVVGPIWQGPGLDTQGDNEELTIGRVSIEHVNSGPSYFGPAAVYHYDEKGFPVPAVRLRGHNIVAENIQTEASPLSLLIECVGCTINSIHSNEFEPPAVVAKNSGLVKIQGDSIAVQILSYTSFSQPPYSILDVSQSSGVNHNLSIGHKDDARGTYFQVATVDDLTVGTSLTSTAGPVHILSGSGELAALFATASDVAQIQLAPNNSPGYGIIYQATREADKVGPDGRFRLRIGSLWNGNFTAYGDWSDRGLKVLGEVTASRVTTAVANLTGSTAVADWSAAGAAALTLDSNATVDFVNHVSGQTYRMAVTNTGDYTVTWPANVKWPGGTAPVQTTGAHTDIYTFIQVGAEIYGIAAQNF